MLAWVWNRIALSLPDDWEMLQFSKDAARGRCAFADRYRYRLELSWSAVPGEPDFDRMMSDYAQKLEQDGKMTGVQPVRVAAWRGLVGRTSTGAVARYGRWIAQQARLVEVVFLWPGARNEALEQQVLASIQPVEPDADGLVAWRAFGLDLRVPHTFTLQSCLVQAARAGFLFRGASAAETWIFRRYGMVECWLKTGVDRWLETQVPADIREAQVQRGSDGNQPCVRLSGRYRPHGLLKKRGVFAAAAWQHARDRRLYLAMLTNPQQSPHAGREADRYLKAAPEFAVVPGSAV